MADLLARFRQAYTNLDLLPLLEKHELEKFRVEYGANVLAELQQLVEDDDSRRGKIIFAGHRGCGKSTLLAEFGRRCRDTGYFVVFFSIADTIEMSDVNHINILFAIAVNLMYEAELESIDIPPSTKEAFYKWFANRTRTEIESPINAEISAGFNIFEIFRGKLKTEASVRNEIKQEFERKISELVAQIDIMAAAIQAVSKQKVLVIIDDLDKLDLAVVRDVYREHIKALFQPGFQIIYTTPVASLRDAPLRAMMISETDDQIVEMPVAKLYHKGESRETGIKPINQNQAILCEILTRRIDIGLMEAEIAEAVVFYSGGVLRELIRIANKCCRLCLRQIRQDPQSTNLKIDQKVLDQAIQDIRLDFETPLGKTDYIILRETYEKFEPNDPKAQAFLDLLHGLHILEYRNAQIWYDVHPIVADLLRLKELVE